MSFFHNSSGFIINGGNYINFRAEDAASASATRDGLMILNSGDVELRRELISGDHSEGDNSYRIHAASHRGRLVAVKTFEGPHAKQDWNVNVAFLKKSLHPNVLKIVGISDKSSESHFILFHGITSERKMQWLIANALKADLNGSVQLSMKAVKGIAAGLSYIKSQKIPVIYAEAMDNSQKWDNFDILTGHENEPIIAFHLSSTIHYDSVSQNSDIKTDSRGIDVLNGLCDQLFSGANSILYDDSPERESGGYDSEGLLAASLEHEERTNHSKSKNTSNPNINSMESPEPSRKPRREVWWLRLDLDATNHSLKSIGRCFEDRLNWSLLSSSNSLLRHVRSPKDDNLRQFLHQCPGYLREEITLTCDLSKSAIVSHAFPAPSERCSICHQLVQYMDSGPIDILSPLLKKALDGVPPTDELVQLHKELELAKEKALERRKKANDDLKTIEESIHRTTEREMAKSKATDKITRERDSSQPHSLSLLSAAASASNPNLSLSSSENPQQRSFSGMGHFRRASGTRSVRGAEAWGSLAKPNPNLSLSSSKNPQQRFFSPGMGHFRRASSGTRSLRGAEVWGSLAKSRIYSHPINSLPGSSSRSSLDPRRSLTTPVTVAILEALHYQNFRSPKGGR